MLYIKGRLDTHQKAPKPLTQPPGPSSARHIDALRKADINVRTQPCTPWASSFPVVGIFQRRRRVKDVDRDNGAGAAVSRGVYEIILSQLSGDRGARRRGDSEMLEFDSESGENLAWSLSYSFLSPWVSAYVNGTRKVFVGEGDETNLDRLASMSARRMDMTLSGFPTLLVSVYVTNL